MWIAREWIIMWIWNGIGLFPIRTKIPVPFAVVYELWTSESDKKLKEEGNYSSRCLECHQRPLMKACEGNGVQSADTSAGLQLTWVGPVSWKGCIRGGQVMNTQSSIVNNTDLASTNFHAFYSAHCKKLQYIVWSTTRISQGELGTLVWVTTFCPPRSHDSIFSFRHGHPNTVLKNGSPLRDRMPYSPLKPGQMFCEKLWYTWNSI